MALEGLFVMLLIGWIVISLFTAAHASENGKTSLWGVVVFVFGFFGLVFYAISLAGDN